MDQAALSKGSNASTSTLLDELSRYEDAVMKTLGATDRAVLSEAIHAARQILSSANTT
jgi:hypothetical protein